MRNYQRKRQNPYLLPHNVYMQVLYLIRDYDRMQQVRADILNGSAPHDGTPHTAHGNPTESKAIKLASLDHRCEQINAAIASVPREYRKAVWENICRRAPYPSDAGEATYKRWRCRFVWQVAKNMDFI